MCVLQLCSEQSGAGFSIRGVLFVWSEQDDENDVTAVNLWCSSFQSEQHRSYSEQHFLLHMTRRNRQSKQLSVTSHITVLRVLGCIL